MEEIKVGDYIRTKQWGIAKVAKIDEKGKCTHIKNKNNRITHYFEQIGRTSQNIIDLIEVGDYVNGCNVVGIKNDGVVVSGGFGEIWLSQIENIVTREQFELAKYEVI